MYNDLIRVVLHLVSLFHACCRMRHSLFGYVHLNTDQYRMSIAFSGPCIIYRLKFTIRLHFCLYTSWMTFCLKDSEFAYGMSLHSSKSRTKEVKYLFEDVLGGLWCINSIRLWNDLSTFSADNECKLNVPLHVYIENEGISIHRLYNFQWIFQQTYYLRM